ncbi:hypothetical protein [Enterococcus viikkiensis]|nr:hypothetical protein [Enterococcus viikkiensis]
MLELDQKSLPYLTIASSIITMTSVQAFNLSDYLMNYATTKAAIANVIVSLAVQLIKKSFVQRCGSRFNLKLLQLDQE